MTFLDLLLIEDNYQDVILVKEALKELEVEYYLTVASNGEDALQLLTSKKIAPHIILLDLNLPRISGLEVLKRIKSSDDFRRIPVIVLTNSSLEKDVSQAYDEHCNAYIRKPFGFEALSQRISDIVNFWFKTATLPPTD